MRSTILSNVHVLPFIVQGKRSQINIFRIQERERERENGIKISVSRLFIHCVSPSNLLPKRGLNIFHGETIKTACKQRTRETALDFAWKNQWNNSVCILILLPFCSRTNECNRNKDKRQRRNKIILVSFRRRHCLNIGFARRSEESVRTIELWQEDPSFFFYALCPVDLFN